MVIATGFFDGVHLGHRAVIETLVSAARSRHTESMVITLWPHPRMVLQQDAASLRLLSSLEEKRERLLSLGVDRVEVLRFTRSFSAMSAEQYLREILIGEYGATAMVLGYDNRLGGDERSSTEVETLARSMGLEVIRTEAVDSEGLTVSSTKIRAALSRGEVTRASEMLGYDYSLSGVVVSGNGYGRRLGYPTANMKLYSPLKIVPGRGVYFTAVDVLDHRYWGMTNIGLRPTLTSDTEPVIETNIFDFDEDIYGLDLRVEFVSKIRDEVRFDSVDALRDQLSKDKELCLKMSKSHNAAL